MIRVEHIGIAVRNLAEAKRVYEKLLATTCYKTESVTSEMVNTAFFKTGATKIELLESSDETGPVSKFLEKRGEGIHHIAFEVDDIEAEVKRLVNSGFSLVNEIPKEGADNKLVCFLHPKSTNGVLIELCMEKKPSS